MFRRVISTTGLLVTLLLPLATTGCGGGDKEVKHSSLKPGEMPMGGKWAGVYYSQVYGYLHLTEQGGAVTGAWRNTAGDKWGELAGEADGRLLKFEWNEHTIGAIGAGADSSGKGVFLYKVSKENEPHEIQGQWGLGENECCEEWDAVKQMNRDPDPKSVRPDEIEGRVSGGGWDDEEGGGDEGGGDDEGDEGGGDEGGGDEGGGDEGGGDDEGGATGQPSDDGDMYEGL
jgi:hypothetical protein